MPRRSRPKSQRQYVVQNDATMIAAGLAGAKAAAMPGFIAPCLATSNTKVPRGAQWIHEIKFDGYRLQLHKRDIDIRFYTRRGHDWTKRFPALQAAAWYLPAERLILDGEVIVPTEDGHSDFAALESDLGSGRCDRFVFFAFDILYIGSRLLRGCTLEERKHVLAELLSGASGAIRYSEDIEGGGEPLFRRACKLELEGLVSKRKDSTYRSGRSADWTKRTCRQRDTFVAAGIAFKRGRFNGVYLGRREDGELRYAGKVERGFDPGLEQQLRARADKLKRRTQPLTRKIRKPKATWLEPKLLVEVEYRALTRDGKLRHPTFKGIREDLSHA
ncbi:MAG TPA: non-homologous end-joining DNA ligase [Pseudolabrys sp.]|nr:non-homologous end-joining DNA ligase [Pseudolabrys sp.]